jgi:hypothetical protein
LFVPSDVRFGAELLMARVTELEVPPPGAGLITVTEAVPAFAIFAAGTVTVSWVSLIKRGLFSRVPFQVTAEV